MSQDNGLTERQCSFLSSEYSLLRAEILKRMEFKADAMKFNLLIFSIFLTIMGLPRSQPIILLVFPIASLFIAFRYRESDMKIAQLGLHLLKTEGKLGVNGWEVERSKGNYLSDHRSLGPLDSFQSRGVFIITQVLGVTLWFFLRAQGPISWAEWIFLPVDFAAATITLLALRHHRTDNVF